MTSIKTPISLLQEVLVQQWKYMPVYEEVPSDLVQFPFKYKVKFETVEAFGYAHTKKEAKQNCAQQALLMIGVGSSSTYINHHNNNVLPKTVVASANVQNYIGILHEHAAAYQIQSPKYSEHFPQNGLFVVECNFMSFKTEGLGTNKKLAKQDASKKMLEKLETEHLNYQSYQNISRGVDNPDLLKMVLDKYENMSLTSEKSFAQASELILPKIETRREIFTLEDLVKKLKSIGYKYSVEMFQRDPYIMVLRVDKNCVVMGHGKTKEEATDDLLNTAQDMFLTAFPFKTAF